MVARQSVPVIGTQGGHYLEEGAWQFNYSYRYFKSERHFVGPYEDKSRQRENSQVINEIHLMDFGLTHAFTKRFSGSAALPVLFATRSTPIRGASGDVIDRDLQRAEGIGDMVIQGSAWILDPDEFEKGNLQLSLGVKLPTGDDDVRHMATIRRGNTFTREERTVDQSIMPGDGGFGAVIGLQAFYNVFEEFSAFAAGTYLLNPRGTNGVPTFRTTSGEEEMSVTDQYLGRVGIARGIPFLEKYGLGLSVACRIEGVPVRDLLGPDDGFRRPGYAVSVEPGISWSYGGHTLGVSAPIALYRNRQRSVPEDEAVPKRHGDASFADYMILFSYSWVFGGPSGTSGAACPPEQADTILDTPGTTR